MLQSELTMLQNVFSKCNLQFSLLNPECLTMLDLDLGLRKLLGFGEHSDNSFSKGFVDAKNNVIYRLTDYFFCSYIYFLLPGTDSPTLAVLGPYLTLELTYEQLLEQFEIHNISSDLFHKLEKYYGSIPVLKSDNTIFALVNAFAELIWGGSDKYSMIDINYELSQEPVSVFSLNNPIDTDDTNWDLSSIEKRYAHENEMIQAVSTGQTHKAELLMSGFSNLSFERRLADPVRNIKNYCIIMNTLLRKAAESGGVHPLYLDRISSGFAKDIESLTSTDAAQALMDKMLHSYCRLVRKNATQNFSPPIQKTIMYINTNISGDLSLNFLADELNMNASYLSALFKKETGTTVTDFVNQKRVQRASELLKTTKLQIQTIAQHCGISDVNYFSKIFKKYTGSSPKEFRKDLHYRGHSV